MENPRYMFVIRSSAMQARCKRRARLKRLALAGAIVAALLAPGTLEKINPSACEAVWVCS